MEENLLKALPWIIAMAVAFIGLVVFGTLLFVKRKKKTDVSRTPDAYDNFNRAQNAGKQAARRTDDTAPTPADKIMSARDAIYRSQKPDRADFGYTLQNPVITSSTGSSEAYLGILRTEAGEPVTWVRTRTVSLNDLNGAGPAAVEEYVIYLHGRDSKKRIYICPEGKNSLYAPEGFIISSDKKPTRYNGSIAREAEENGITTDQVLSKHAFIYENSHPAKPAPQQVQPAAAKQSVRPATERPVPQPAAEQYASRVEPEIPADRPAEAQPAVTGSHERKPAAESVAANDAAPSVKKTDEVPKSADVSSLPKYLPGFEPENVRVQLDKFFAVINKAFPDGIVYESEWDHAHWDNAAGMLCRYLGYSRGSEFLEAYGYTFIKS